MTKDSIELAVTEVGILPVSVIEAQNRSEIDVQIATAHRYPRNSERSVQNVIAVISNDKELAGTCVYSMPRAGKEIKGPSVHLARYLASEYGNMRVDAKIVEIGDTMITAQAVALDLEKNYAMRTEVKRRITDKQGNRYADDMIVMTCNAALAIASRNAILQVIPLTAVNRVYKAAQKAIVGDLSTEQKLLTARMEILKGFHDSYAVTEAEILTLLGLETVNQIKQDQLLTLVGLAQAIKDGDTSIVEAFNRNAQSNISTETKAKVQEAIDKANAKRKENSNTKTK